MGVFEEKEENHDMKNNKKRLMIYSMLCFVMLFVLKSNVLSVKAADSIVPKASNNIQIALRDKSELVVTDNGYMRVYYAEEKIGVEYYDEQFNITSKKSFDMELDYWGGFYAGKTAYYIVEGKANTEENDLAEVIRVIQYDKNWNKTGVANITSNPDLFGGEVRYPFDYGCVEMTECNGVLYVVTGHEGYVDSNYGQGHQGYLMVAVHEATMKGEIVDCDYWHSFAQYIDCKNSDLYVLEQSEGSRCTILSKYNANDLTRTSIPVLKYGGSHTSAWAIACYASVDGMALSSDNVLCLGTSIDQSKYDEKTSDTPHNLYLTVTPQANFTEEATTIKWLTNYTGGGKSFLGTEITKINDNCFMVSWEETDEKGTADENDTLSDNIMHYVFIDGNGNKVSSEYTAAAPVSDCKPIVNGSKIVYYASNDNMVNFYTIDANTGAFSKRCYQVAGDSATWNLKEGVLTLGGTGDIVVDTKAKYRYPLSSTASSYAYSSSDNSWKPIRDKVQKIVVEEGLTSIAMETFAGFSSLIEVEIKPGLKSIGEKAFYCCGKLSKITIPSSVETIGDNFLWTGAYWVGSGAPVVRATIYAPENSYAITYAKQNNIKYSIDKEDVEESNNSQDTQNKEEIVELPEDAMINSLIQDTENGIEYKLTSVDENNPTVTFTKYEGSKKEVVIPDVIEIGDVYYKVISVDKNAFKNNTNITKVTIGKNVETIGSNAFNGCIKLRSVTIGKNVTTIGNKAFYNCKSLTKVTIPSKVIKIGDYAFKNCKKLYSVTIGKKVKKIGKEAFKGCGKLKSIHIKSKRLKNVGKNAFKGIKTSAKIKVPSSKLKTYKKLLKNKGQSKKVKIIK